MKKVIGVYAVMLIVLSSLAAAQEDTSVAAQAGASGVIEEDALVGEERADASVAASEKCGFFCKIENWLSGSY